MQKRWTIKKHSRQRVQEFAGELNIPQIVAALLISRGIDTYEKAQKFLYPKVEDLHDPYLFKDMDIAVKRILKAIETNEKILIWGDYDVDGTTGTVVLRKGLEILGAKTNFHIPHRFSEGYGLNIEHLSKAKERGYSLVITVDNGSRAFEAADWAAENNLDLIITDHHLPDESKGNPKAVAVINPNQNDCSYPDKNLAGVGVALKLVQALLREKGKENILSGFFKMAAIGTIADIMNLSDENRTIVFLGLKDLPKAKNHGLRALIEVADCNSEMTSLDIGFRIAPRINAAGRMDAARQVVELFEADSFEKAREYAEMLDTRNRERQTIQRNISELALSQFAEQSLNNVQSNVVVVAGEGWHRGVIGLASSKITDKVYRPSLVISLENGIGHGSARSISGYHLLDGLDACRDLFEKFGGHAAACGFTIKEENIEKLRERLNSHFVEKLSDEDLIPEIKIDAPLSSKSLNLELVENLRVLEPYGQGNPRPIFATKDLILADNPFVMKGKHLKFKLRDTDGKYFEAVWWDGIEKSNKQTFYVNQSIEIAYTVSVNNWNGNSRLQLIVEDIKV